MKQSFFLLFILFLFGKDLVAQVTTSNISGIVKDQNGQPLPGAIVTATLTSTGTVYGSATRDDGQFDIPNVASGGPYTISAKTIGFIDHSENGVYLKLGETRRFVVNLKESTTKLSETVVLASKFDQFSQSRMGTETSLSKDKINALPTVGRNLWDLLRATPQVQVTGLGGVSVAGQNNRYNQIMFDGAVNNDVFGLSATGSNGGQANTAPISFDAIEQINVNVAPYDVSLSNFTGGSVNAITRSGTNDFEGSVYYFLRNQTLAGRTPTNYDTLVRTKLAPFSAQTFGVRLGGALIRSKLFLFVNGEIVREEFPQPFVFNDYQGTYTEEDVDRLSDFVRTKYGYDPGGYLNNTRQNKSNRLVTRLDWNLSRKNKVTLSYRYNSSEAIKANRSSNTKINFANNGEFFPSRTHSLSGELNSTISNKLYNKLLLGYTNVLDDRGSIGSDFPYVIIRRDSTKDLLEMGTEQFSTGNLLKQNNFTFFDKINYYLGKHALYAGVDAELSSSYNLFIRQAFGVYTYKSIDDFINGAKPTQYDRSYSLLPGDKSVDGSKAAAEFKTMRVGIFLGDNYSISEKLRISGGIRVDAFSYITTPTAEKFFNDTALAVLNQYYDLNGAKTGDKPKTSINFSPRIGFNYNPIQKLQIRGGAGIFVGRVPLVWPGGIYQYDGTRVGSVRSTNPALISGETLPFSPDINDQYTVGSFSNTVDRVPQGEVDIVDPEFKLPKIFKASLGVDYQLPWGVTSTVEFLYQKNLTEMKYVNLNVNNADSNIVQTGGADSRDRYKTRAWTDLNPYTPGNQNPYTDIMYITNSEKKGQSYTFSVLFDKQFKEGFSANVSYTYGRSRVYMDGTSSQNTSQWRYIESVNGRNNLELSYSDFDLGHRINAFVAKRFEYGPKQMFATSLSLFYNGQSGYRFSYVYNGELTNDVPAGTNGDLIFIPASRDQINLVDIAGGKTADQQYADLEDYIANDKYLKENQGKFTDRNGARTPFTHTIDLRLIQDFYLTTGSKKHNLQLTFDIFNFTNMLNKDWGRTYFVTNDNYQLIQYKGVDGSGNPRYNFVKPKSDPYQINDGTINSARWTAQFGIRYTFN